MATKNILAIIFFTLATTATAETYQSGPQQVQLLELYTSQGCSSCPPADRWLSELKNDRNLWQNFVPVAFHVAYWDWIGWDDKYARKAFDQRQRSYASNNASSSVYTPGFFLNGMEWRGFFQHKKSLPQPTKNRVGNLKLTVADGVFTASFDGDGGHQLHIAILAMGLNTDVERGENRGRNLSHDFVVVGYQNYTPKQGSWQGSLPTIGHNSGEYAIAAWVSGEKLQTPIQALGGEFTP